jgi:exodeoxyribonuclease V alpha subunit
MSKQLETAPNITQITGSVEQITFHNEENGFTVLKARAIKNKTIYCIVGKVIKINVGDIIDCEGTWVQNRTYGLQLQAETIIVKPPTTTKGIEKYLASSMVKGIGPGFAKKLVDHFGTEVLDILDNDHERLFELEGIGKKRHQQLVNAWHGQKMVRNIMIFLQSHGIGGSRAHKIYKIYGEKAVDVITSNPYRLANDIHGIGFNSADSLAVALGIDPNSVIRAKAGVKHVLKKLSEQGSTVCKAERLIQETNTLLNIDKDIIKTAITTEITSENIVELHCNGDTILSLTDLYDAEYSIAKNLLRLQRKGKATNYNIASMRQEIERQTQIKLAKSQLEAVTATLDNNVVIITGGPGVGKTTIVKVIVNLHKKSRILLAAPTGRAAKRISQTTNMPAKTIHRLLAFNPQSRNFTYNENQPLLADIVVVDECSMIDVKLMSSLMKAIPSGCKLILVGDVDQLPSVGPGAILQDSIKSAQVKTVALTEIFRQAQDSQIITNAHRINNGDMPLYKNPTPDSDFFFIKSDDPNLTLEKILLLATKKIPQKFNLNPTTEIQVLAPAHKGSLGVIALNTALQKALNPNPVTSITRLGNILATGDKVIQTINNYDKDIYNGDIGFIIAINLTDKKLQIDFNNKIVNYNFDELDEISLAWAITIHKSQGSEYPAVIIPISTQHFTLLQRNLLYTGITRGKQLVVLLGQTKALAMAINNQSATNRATFLAELLRKNSLNS